MNYSEVFGKKANMLKTDAHKGLFFSLLVKPSYNEPEQNSLK